MPEENSGTPGVGQFAIDQELLHRSVLRANIGQEVIVITADRMRLSLIAFDNAQKGRHEWKGALGIFLTAFAALVAADFRAFLGLPADTWRVLFIVAAILSGLGMIRSLYLAVRNRKSCDVEYVLRELNTTRH